MNIIKSQLTSLSRVARFFREKQKLQKSLVLLITQASLKKKDLIIKNKNKNFITMFYFGLRNIISHSWNALAPKVITLVAQCSSIGYVQYSCVSLTVLVYLCSCF